MSYISNKSGVIGLFLPINKNLSILYLHLWRVDDSTLSSSNRSASKGNHLNLKYEGGVGGDDGGVPMVAVGVVWRAGESNFMPSRHLMPKQWKNTTFFFFNQRNSYIPPSYHLANPNSKKQWVLSLIRIIKFSSILQHTWKVWINNWKNK